jgi:hypothetical protein
MEIETPAQNPELLHRKNPQIFSPTSPASIPAFEQNQAKMIGRSRGRGGGAGAGEAIPLGFCFESG